MADTVQDRLAEFAATVRANNDAINLARGKKAERLSSELSAFIGKQVQAFLAKGLPVMEIQTAQRAATDVVEQTHAPDVEAGIIPVKGWNSLSRKPLISSRWMAV